MYFNADYLTPHGSCVLSAYNIYTSNLLELGKLHQYFKSVVNKLQSTLTIFILFDLSESELDFHKVDDSIWSIENEENFSQIFSPVLKLYYCLEKIYEAFPHIEISVLPITDLTSLTRTPDPIIFDFSNSEQFFGHDAFPNLFLYYKNYIEDYSEYQFFLPNHSFRPIVQLDREICEKLKIQYITLDPHVTEPELFSSFEPPKYLHNFSQIFGSQNDPFNKRKRYHEFTEDTSFCFSGTFDHLHLGHMYILISICRLPMTNLFVGITMENLLKHKVHANFIEPFPLRFFKIADYLKKALFYMNRPCPKFQLFNFDSCEPEEIVRNSSKNTIRFFRLCDPFGPAIETNLFSSLIVTDETKNAAQRINEMRGKIGLSPLKLLLFNCVPPNLKNSEVLKFSSTNIRQGLDSTPYFQILYNTLKTLKDFKNQSICPLWWFLLSQYQSVIRLQAPIHTEDVTSICSFEELSIDSNLAYSFRKSLSASLRTEIQSTKSYRKADSQLIIKKIFAFFLYPPSTSLIKSFNSYKEEMVHSDSVLLAILFMFCPSKDYILPQNIDISYLNDQSKRARLYACEDYKNLPSIDVIHTFVRSSLLIKFFTDLSQTDELFSMQLPNIYIESDQEFISDFLWLRDLLLHEFLMNIFKEENLSQCSQQLITELKNLKPSFYKIYQH